MLSAGGAPATNAGPARPEQGSGQAERHEEASVALVFGVGKAAPRRIGLCVHVAPGSFCWGNGLAAAIGLEQ
jgi:hypothetical protein